MTTVAPENRSVLRCIALPSCLFVVFIGCGGESASNTGTTCGAPTCNGATGASGSGGMAGASGASTGSCVSLSGAGREPWYDLTITGTQFNADEGVLARIVVATQAPNRVGIGNAPIKNGAFTLSMPQVLNSGYYVGISLYVDRNQDNACETAEDVWDFTTPIVAGNLQYDVTPDKWCNGASCLLRSQSTQAPCFVGTGQTDLSKPLPCTP